MLAVPDPLDFQSTVPSSNPGLGKSCVVEPPRLALWPSGLVSVTLTIPAEPEGGVTAVNDVLLTNVTLVASVLPNFTVAPETKLVPVRLTLVPPATGPEEGEMDVSVGAGFVA